MPTLQELINSAAPGATITLPDNSEHVGNFVISKSLTIVGGAGTRILAPPAHSATTHAMPAIEIKPGCGPVVLRRLNISVTAEVKSINDIIRYGGSDLASGQTTLDKCPQGLWLDECDVFGRPDVSSQRGIAANGANFKATKTKVREIHWKGFDTQAICSWNGPGPFLIEDCYLEAAAENVMFGGALPVIPNLVPSDITIRRCYFFKPLSWRGVWSIKNLFELKNARRVLIEGNIFENNWTDAQAGRAIVFTPRPSDSGSWAVIEDVVFQYNIIRNVGSGMLILGADEAPAPTETRLRRVRVANNLWENVNGPQFGSNGYFLTVINKTEDVVVEHNTAFQTGHIIGTDYGPNAGFIYRDNISRHNEYGIFGGGKSTGNATISYYFPGSVITSNVIAKEVKGSSSPSNHEAVYPAGNFFPETLSAVGFDDKFRLLASSPFKGKGSGGSDPGCDIDKLTALIGGTATPTPVPDPPPPPPPTKTPSPDGTKAVTIIDAQLATWTLGPERQTLRDGVHVGNGSGTIYKWLGGIVYVLGTNAWWYKWTGTSWQSVSQLEPGTEPTTRIQPWPKQQGQQNALVDQQWAAGRYRLKRIDGNTGTFEKVA